MEAFGDGLGDFLGDASEEEKNGFNVDGNPGDITDENLLSNIPDEEDEEEIKKPQSNGNPPADEEDEEEQLNGRGSQQNNNDSSKYYSALITTLSESLPYITLSEEDKITDVTTLRTFMENKIEEEVKRREFSDLTETQKEYFESIRDGVPHEVVKQSIEISDNLNSITDANIEENEEIREQLIYNAYLDSGLSEERANKLTQLSIKNGLDVDDAKDSLAQLKQSLANKTKELRDKALRDKQDAQTKYQESMKTLRKTIDSPEEVLGEKNLSKKYKNELYELITNPIDVNGKSVDFLNKFISENPINSRVILGHLYLMTDGFKADKLSGVNAKKVRSKANEDLHKLITGSSDGFQFGNSTDEDSFTRDSNDDIGFSDMKLF